MTRSPARALALCGALTIGGCALVADLLGLAEMFLLGVIPTAGFSDPGSADHGKAEVALGGEDEDGLPIIPPSSLLEVDSDQSDVELEETEEVEGHPEGSLVFLADGSGSMYSSDPERIRVEAAGQMATELANCGPDWRMALMEFGAGSDSGFTETAVRVDYTSDPDAIAEGAAGLSESGYTPLWDSLSEVLADLDGDAKQAFESGAGRGLVVLSDGEDLDSSTTLEEVVDQAQDLGISVHVVGLGEASDLAEGGGNQQAIADLRYLASKTGGYFAAVSAADELPAVTKSVAKAHCGGHTKLVVRFADPPPAGEEVTGNVRVKNTDISVPYRFVSP